MNRIRLAAAMAVLCGALAACGEKDGPAAPANPSPAYKLAVIQNGSTLSESDPLVTQFQSALDDLSAKCSESADELAGYTDATRHDLEKNGVDESYLSVLRHVDQSVPSSAAPISCGSMFAAYAVLREGSS